MHALRSAAAGLAFAMLGACSMLPQPDYRAALMQPCANAADIYPWSMSDVWKGGVSYTPAIQFADKGRMLYAYDGNTFDNGRWSLVGAALHIDTNDHYADYDGMFSGAKAKGAMRNQAGETGAWTLVRSCEP